MEYILVSFDIIPQNNVGKISSVLVDQNNFQLIFNGDGLGSMDSGRTPVKTAKLSIAPPRHFHPLFTHAQFGDNETVAHEESLTSHVMFL